MSFIPFALAVWCGFIAVMVRKSLAEFAILASLCIACVLVGFLGPF